MTGLVVAIVVAIAFDFTNGFHDSANATAALVVTRAARPGQAVVLASAFTVLGPVLAGTAVADTVGGASSRSIRHSWCRSSDGGTVTSEADAAIKCVQGIERSYRLAMSKLLIVEDAREVTGRRELYRRYARLGEALESVAERVWYSVVKKR